MTGVRVQLAGVSVAAGARTILDVAALEFAPGETTAVLGSNGAGKSTLVRIAAGLREPDDGAVRLDGRVTTAAERRALAAAVLQRPLLGRGSARRNAELGLRFAGVEPAEARRRAAAWLERLGVAHLANRPARGLSGGEAQRISLARALVLEPRLLVLDEPFAPLDVSTRGALLEELRALLAAASTTTLLVTHDPGEAAALAAKVVVLDDGRVLQHGPVGPVFAAPATPAAARLLGYDNVLDPAGAANFGAGHAIAFRAADLAVRADRTGAGRVIHSVPVPGGSRVHVELAGTAAVGMSDALGGLPPGATVSVSLACERSARIG